ncbi:dihydrofolate reductase family protein [Microbacterium enclense]|uniref:Dihydrofolate reductase n=1 Tax=Microbacterium enclense TaxID=993073 RepID=A0A1G6GL60_9MICO|nr:dihydrofolate reductase family protein [Microbacterium enclense]KSU56335.1 hypothetical protein AS029_00810 [Microbacterium enclense]SDB82748.1 Dihydrofolate reductase [Microbacterium enclense]
MSRIIVEQLITADGFVQDSDGGMKFMDVEPIDDADSEQMKMLSRVGGIVLGRRTYEMFSSYWPAVDPADEPVAGWINSLPKHIISNTLDSAPWGDLAPAIIERGDPAETVARLRSKVEGDLIVWGSLQLTDALFREGLVDVLRLRVVPSLIGEGRGPTPADIGQTVISQVASHAGPGWVTIEYQVANRDDGATSGT